MSDLIPPPNFGEIVINGDSRLLKLKAVGIVGGSNITLQDESGHLNIRVPSQLWPWIQPGDHIFTTIGVFKASVDSVPMTGMPFSLDNMN